MHTKSAPPRLYYVHDPMCSWCWGFRPVWMRLRERLAETVRIESVLGGLAPDTEEPMPRRMRTDIQNTWKSIQQSIPGTAFNFDFWTLNTPRRSTWSACRAVLCAGFQNTQAGDDMVFAIQKAYYTQARNPSDAEVLEDLAAALGLDRKRFAKDLLSEEAEQALRAQFMLRDRLDARSFPSLVLEVDGRYRHIAINYTDEAPMLGHVYSLMS